MMTGSVESVQSAALFDPVEDTRIQKPEALRRLPPGFRIRGRHRSNSKFETLAVR